LSREEKNKIKFSNLLSKRDFVIVALFFLIILGGLTYIFYSPNYYDSPEPFILEVRRGDSFDNITTKLKHGGLIKGSLRLKILAKLYGADRKVTAARYYVPNGLSLVGLIEHLLYAERDYLRKVNVHKGSTIPWLAHKMRREALIDSSQFVEWAFKKEFLDSLEIEAHSIEGYLLPKDYYIYERSHAKEALAAFYRGFTRFWHDTLKLQAETIGYTIREITTIASIIEGETNKVEEMDTIAGVYYNRLRIGMKLQADPTVQYTLPEGWRRLLYEDYKIDHPYNTYIHYGLPPGPINNPGEDALLAALYPANHNYIFFVADGLGGHRFASNYAQHLKYVREFREWRKKQQQQRINKD
jgi:UPF0755 protein